MKSFHHLVLTTIAALSVCHSASAQQVYRCGNSYSQTPCAGAVAVSTDDPRTDNQRAQAKQGLTSDKALAKDLEATRRTDESIALAQMKAAQASQSKKVAAAKPPEKKVARKKAGTIRTVKVDGKEPEFFTATDGATTKKKKTAAKSAAP
jgi:K+-sensing histidine kinase KdpD